MKPVVRCSELPQLLSCGGSRTLKKIVAPMENDEGQEGTMIHGETARRCIKQLGAVSSDSQFFSNAFENTVIPKNSEWLVEYFVRFARDNYPREWALEVEVPVAYEFDRFILSGHFDISGVNTDGSEWRGSDWKSCYVPPSPAPENDQILGYACLNRLAYPKSSAGKYDLVCPRNDEDEGFERVTTLDLDRNQMDACLSSLNDRVNAALDTPMQLVSGVKQCAWCDAAMQCPALIADRELMKMTLTEEQLALIKAMPDDATLGDWMVASKTLAKPLEIAKELAKERIAKAGYIDAKCGTRITAKVEKGAYKVLDPLGFLQAIKQIIPEEKDQAKTMSFSMTRTKDVISDVMDIPKTGKKAPVTAESVFDASLRPLTEQGTKTTLIYS